MTKKTATYFFILLLIILFYDIGNLDGLRQGTEGFYLLISQEMYEAGTYLSPRIYGDYHWSKPPLQFLFPMPFFKTFGGSYLLWARVSILLFSLSLCFLISFWYEENLKRNWHEAFGFLLVGFYFMKYSRIFMIEASLSYLSTYGLLLAYSWLKKPSNKKSLLLSSLVTGASVLTKGPVSLAMINPPLFLITFLRKLSWKKLFSFYALSFVFGSLWFLAMYAEHGNAFFEYFFVRENLGKFNARSYPISRVIQGLFVYSFPAFLFLIPILKNKTSSFFKRNDFNLFACISFCFFFFLWFLPKQKSHHYAVPSIPLLLLFISFNFFNLKKGIRNKSLRIASLFGSAFMAIGGCALGSIYLLKDSLNLNETSLHLTGALFLFGFWTYSSRFKEFSFPILRLLVPQILFWIFLIPLGVLPAVPNTVIEKLQKTKSEVFVDYRKPFFIKEALNRDIQFFPKEGLGSDQIQPKDFVYIQEEKFKGHPQNGSFETVLRWKVWKRGNRIDAITKALLNRDLRPLQEFYTLVQKQ